MFDFALIFRRFLGVIMALGAGANSSLSRGGADGQTTPNHAEKWDAEGAKIAPERNGKPGTNIAGHGSVAQIGAATQRRGTLGHVAASPQRRFDGRKK